MAKRKMITSKSIVEIIAVSIDDKVRRTYHDYLGTFAGFAYNCVDKKALPGNYRKGFVKKATLSGKRLELSFSGKHTQEDLTDILDSALLNLVAFPHEGSEAEFFIEAKSNK